MPIRLFQARVIFFIFFETDWIVLGGWSCYLTDNRDVLFHLDITSIVRQELHRSDISRFIDISQQMIACAGTWS